MELSELRVADEDVCLTCIRIGWKQWLSECLAKKIPLIVILKAKELLQEVYKYDCTTFAHYPPKTIKAALIYFAQFIVVADTPYLTQKEVGQIFNCSTGSIRNLAYRIKRIRGMDIE